MVPKILSSGRSFKGLAQYLTHDPKAQTQQRVAWTHTLNCAHDDPASAVHEMYTTQLDAEALKEQAGVRAGGRALQKPVKHFSLNWHPNEEPTREHMIATTEGFLKHMGWQEHQALLVAHSDTEHPHVHVMLNAIHPETGLKLDDGLERRRAQEWARQYELEHGTIYCQQRMLDPADRQDSPTREAALKMREAEQKHEQAETARRAYDADYMKREENRKVMAGEEWGILKTHQREQREAFFAEGKQAYGDLKKAAYREVREEFRSEWAEYYAAKRDGMASERLQEIRDDILARQNATLDARFEGAADALREQRDATYAELLAQQKEARHELHAAQEQGQSSPHLLDLVARGADTRESAPDHARGAFAAAAEEVCARSAEQGSEELAPEAADEFHGEPHNGVKSADDAVGGLGLGMIGAVALIGERFFDGFFGADPLGRKPQAPQPAPASQETKKENPFAKVAAAAREQAEIEAEKARERAYWEERQRTRD
ncbi:MAG: relaxase/mobilization nuclease domain-containing protein [Pseudomonadota bacterium]